MQTKQPSKVASPAISGSETLQEVRVVVNGIGSRPAADAKTSGIKTRGNGAATRGVTARGPMA